MDEYKESVEGSSVERNVDTISNPFELEIGEEEGGEQDSEDEHFEQSVEQISEKLSMKLSTTESRSTRKIKASEKSIVLDDKGLKELRKLYDPSYRNLIVENRILGERTKNFRRLLRSELKTIAAEQITAFDSVKVHRLYKTGMKLPAWIFLDNNTGYNFREVQRLRFLLSNEII